MGTEGLAKMGIGGQKVQNSNYTSWGCNVINCVAYLTVAKRVKVFITRKKYFYLFMVMNVN